MNLKDLSATTVLLAILYFTAYSFYRGYSEFFGFPSSFISIGVPELVKYSVFAVGIMFSLVALLHFDSSDNRTDGGIPLKWVLMFGVFSVIFVFMTFYVIGGNGYLFKNNTMALIGQSLIIGVFGLIGVRTIPAFFRNGCKLKGKTNSVMLVGTLVFLPSGFGWAVAYLPYEPLFYSKDNQAYILATYNNNFVLGSCHKEHARYLMVDKISGDVTPVSGKETQELKTCFLRSSERYINRS